MIINIYGSTGIIGSKSLDLVSKYFPKLKINLLVANNNIKKMLYQVNKYSPKYVFLNDNHNNIILKKALKNTKVVVFNELELKLYLKENKSDYSILCVSGYNSLLYFEYIINNTLNLGLVSKECIVSAGHLFKNIFKKNKVKIFPLDSEHFSLFDYFNLNKIKKYKNINKIFLTASGGPFLNLDLKQFKYVSLAKAINHPTWKMGYKNSIDSATMANKCLEIIEAKYLFDIPFEKIDIIIHPQSLVHSIVENNNYTSYLNYFYNDMSIPIFNFLNQSSLKNINFVQNTKYNFKKNISLKFQAIDTKRFPIYKIFLSLDKSDPLNLIKFNCANEYSVDLFKNGLIKFDHIPKIIRKCLLIDIDYPVNTIKNIIKFNKIYLGKLNEITI